MEEEKLREYRELKREAMQLKQRIREINSEIDAIGRRPEPYGATGRGRKTSRVESVILKLEELRTTYLKKLDENIRVLEEVEKAIDNLPAAHRIIMRAYYVEGAGSWYEVADKTNYSLSRVMQLRKESVRRICGE